MSNKKYGVIFHERAFGKSATSEIIRQQNDKIKKLEDRVKDLERKCIDAFMAGQSDCGVDPSHSNAIAWAVGNKVTTDE